MAKRSAWLLLCRTVAGAVDVLLVHPGGPFWAKRDDGAWSIAKGEVAAGEDPLQAALREFREEMGQSIRGGHRIQVIATNAAALWPRVTDGAFTERLYYRLNVIYIDLTDGAALSIEKS